MTDSDEFLLASVSNSSRPSGCSVLRRTSRIPRLAGTQLGPGRTAPARAHRPTVLRARPAPSEAEIEETRCHRRRDRLWLEGVLVDFRPAAGKVRSQIR